MNNDSKQILIYGGTGYYGRKITEKLLLKGQPVKVVSRNAASARKLLGNKVEITEGDVTDKTIIAESLKNVQAIIICLSASNFKQFRKRRQIERDAVLSIMKEAKKANISRLVYLSGYEMRENIQESLKIKGNFNEIMVEIEKEITHSDFNWTILGCSPSFMLFFAFTKNGKMTVPGGGKIPIPSISADDVGEIAAQTVMRNDLSGRRLKLTTSQAHSFPEVAEKISAISGKKVKHITIPLLIINIVSFLALPVNPFVRYLYNMLKLLNSFPSDLAQKVPEDHQILRNLFDYTPVTLEMEIKRRVDNNLI